MSRRRATCAWITAAVPLVAALAACAGGPPKEKIGPPPGMETASPGFAAASSGGGDRATATGEGLPTLAGAPDLAGKTPSGHVELRDVEIALLGAAGGGQEAPEALSPGKHTLEFDLKYDGLGFATLAFNNLSGIGRGGTGVLKVDGQEVATQKMEHTVPLILQWDETFDVGADTGTPVDDKDYQVPFAFTGQLTKLTVSLDRPKLTPEDEKRLAEAQRNNRASE